ncbi:MAG TPA: hypothetical protein VN729_08265 [Ktedonobacteraceae bacterium]|nr:hypothetical protein [Ktedonobacteraceae bacterium]
MSDYFIEKGSDTSADTLLAVGFAELLDKVLPRDKHTSSGILIRDAGPYYLLAVPEEINSDDIQRFQPGALLQPLKTEKYADKLATESLHLLQVFEYQREREKSAAYFEQLRKIPAAQRRDSNPLYAQLQPPDPLLGHYMTINQMKIASSFNDLAQRWFYLGELQRQHVQILLDLFSELPNDLARAVQVCQKLAQEYPQKKDVLKKDVFVTALQILNPTSGKGANATKARELTRSIGNQDSFWLFELLKFVGFMDITAPYIIQGSKDRKTYILQPKEAELTALKRIMREFRSSCWSSTAAKLDVLTALRFTKAYVNHRERVLSGEAEKDPFEPEQLYSLAQGFEVTSYKDLGSAFATINIASLNLPRWLPAFKTLEDAQEGSAVLDEHLQLVQRIRSGRPNNEEGAEEYALLRAYRDFLSGNDLKPLWVFTTMYSGYYVSLREGGKYPQQLTTFGLEYLIRMGKQTNYSAIVQSEGFKRIATAIRQATVIAQYRRSQQRDRTYEVRYGLGQELMREVHYPDKFILAISTFLQQYNAETAREEEKVANRLGRALSSQERRAHKLRGSVATSDIDQLIALIDAFGAEAVCSLLVAYGYARDGRPAASDEKSADQAQSTEEDASVVQIEN